MLHLSLLIISAVSAKSVKPLQNHVVLKLLICCLQKEFATDFKTTTILRQALKAAAQIKCLALFVPPLLGDRVNDDPEMWELYLLIIDIFKISQITN